MKLKKGSVRHDTIVEDGTQTDRFRVVVPLSLLDAKGVRLLDYWCIEDFDYAVLDRATGEIVLVYTTLHYLPKGYGAEK